jgi:hypothetical protein
VFETLLTRPTVFLLGAGASKDYGFPLGSELKQRMTGMAQDKSLRKELSQLGLSAQELEDFARALKGTVHPTIDIFLEHKPRWRKLGAYLIAKTIMQAEATADMFPRKHWYGYLYEQLALEAPRAPLTNLSFVSLNYDRSLEHFLESTIEYDCHEARIATARTHLQALRILHPHGALGGYALGSYGREHETFDKIKAASEEIRIISDNLEESKGYADAQAIIAAADRVVILGFGYHKQTIQGLFKRAPKGQLIFGSMKACVPPPEGKTLFPDKEFRRGHADHDCLQFLRALGGGDFLSAMQAQH